MTRISSTYSRFRQGGITTDPVTPSRELPGNTALPSPDLPASNDRISLSQEGLDAAARFSNLVQRPAAMNAPALPAPDSTQEIPVNSTTEESPSSRNMVRRTYAQQHADTMSGSQINVLA